MIPIVLFTISHFWSPTRKTFWQPVSVSLFFMVYTPSPHPQIFFFVGSKKFFFILQLGAGKISNFLGTFFIGQCRIQTFYGHTVFLKLRIGQFSDTQNPLMVVAESPKIFDVQDIWGRVFVCLEKIFVFKYLQTVFHLIFE